MSFEGIISLDDRETSQRWVEQASAAQLEAEIGDIQHFLAQCLSALPSCDEEDIPDVVEDHGLASDLLHRLQVALALSYRRMGSDRPSG